MEKSIKEFEEKLFDPMAFIEKLAKESMHGKDTFDPEILEHSFNQQMKKMKLTQTAQRKKFQLLKESLEHDRETFKQDVTRVQQVFEFCQENLLQLDDKVKNVADKVMNLGGQLELEHTRRLKSVKARNLMVYFLDFLGPGLPCIDRTDNITLINEEANIIRELYSLSRDFPEEKAGELKKKIELKYDMVERSLIEDFVRAQCLDSVSKMKDFAKMLSHFKGYPQCIDAFIEQSQHNILVNKDIFDYVISICNKNFNLISEIFNNPEQVNAKFVLNIYHLKLHNYINTILSDSKDSDKYLENLTSLYEKLKNLNSALKVYNLGNDDTFLETLTKNIFQKHLDSYISVELKNLRGKYTNILQNYYTSLGHQKKPIPVASFQGLRREIQAAIGNRANINIAQIEDYGGEIFISEEISHAMVVESEKAFKRCEMFSHPKDLQSNTSQIFDILFTYLIQEYVSYAIDLGVNSIPLPEIKASPPIIYFFNIAHKVTNTIGLLEKQFEDIVSPLIGTETYFQNFLDKKETVFGEIEDRLDSGLDSSLNTVVGWIKIYLQAEQKKTDFKPELDINTVASPACKVVVQFMRKIVSQVQECVDGKNMENILIELGIRFHRTIYDHLLQYTYNESGALCAICDIDEYKKCINDLNIPLVAKLFDTLHALCNLLLVKPENLEGVCCDQMLSVLDNSVLFSFIQLRSDFKQLKLSSSLKAVA